MRARVVSGGDLGFNAMVYSQPDQRLLDYFNNSINQASEKLGQAGSYFIDTSRSMYERFNGSNVLNATKAIVSRMDTHLNPDVILNLNETNIFNAMPRMQEYIMAQPQMWELNRNQTCSAFDGMYYNVDPKVSTYEDHIRYQEATDGIMQYSKDNDSSYFVTYSSSEMEELHVMDQLSILSTWDTIANMIADDIDPSSLDGSSL